MKKPFFKTGIIALCLAATLSLLASCDSGDTSKSDSSSESKAESSLESVAESKDESVAESEAESEAESVAESEAESEAESVAESEAESEDESKAEGEIEVGVHTMGSLSFSYPKNYTKTTKNGTDMYMDNSNGNNVAYTSIAESNVYFQMTETMFDSLMRPQLEAKGMTVSNFAQEVKTNKNGVKAAAISFTTSYKGITMPQTIYCVNADGKGYIITVTEVVKDIDLVALVFDSFKIEENSADQSEAESEAESESETGVHTMGSVSFEYPKNYVFTTEHGTEMYLNKVSGNNIALTSSPESDAYFTMSEALFNSMLKSQMEAQGMTISNFSREVKTNKNGVKIAIVSFDTSYMGITMAQTQYCVNADGKSYIITLTEVVEDKNLIETVFDTLKISTASEL